MKKYKFSSILGWSSSRFDCFSSCKRMYYYQYYGKYDIKFSFEKIDSLKQLTSIPLEIGNIVHKVIHDLLLRLKKSSRQVNLEKFNAYLKNKLDEIIPSKTFSEIYYQELDSLDIQSMYQKISKNLYNLLDSERFKWLQNIASKSSDNWIIEPKGYGETRIDGLKAYCKVDFAFPVEGCYYIMDWKTGKRHATKHFKQLLGYSVWAADNYSLPSSKIIPIIAYLYPKYIETSLTIQPEDINSFTDLVKQETEQMYKFCIDIEKNIPKPKNFFPLTENKKICAYCNFRELCYSPEQITKLS